MCEFCRYWTRHDERDAAGYCDLHHNSFAMEDDTCSDFDQGGKRNKQQANPLDHTNTTR